MIGHWITYLVADLRAQYASSHESGFVDYKSQDSQMMRIIKVLKQC